MSSAIRLILSLSWALTAATGIARPAEGEPAAPAPKPPKNIVLIGWDGAQRAHVRECLEKDELPALKKLSEEGKLVDIDIREITDTKAGWTQILTGYRAEATGVYSNGKFQPIPKGLTLFERLKKQYGADGIVTVAVVGKKTHVDAEGPRRQPVVEGEVEDVDGAGPNAAKVQEEPAPAGGKKGKAAKKIVEPGSKIVTEDGQQFRVWPGKPYYNAVQAGHEAGLDVWINGLGVNDKVGAKALELLDKYKDKPFCFFVHFADVDHKGHGFGENSREYNDALISSDRWTGKIVEKLRELKLYENTLVLVTADHGFDEDQKSHHNAPTVFLAANTDKVIRGGTRADVTPTILDLLGLDLARFEPALDGQSLARKLDADKDKAVKWTPRGAAAGKGNKRGGKAGAPEPAPAPAPAPVGGEDDK
jgi:arylsulfatase A-like enzyme